MRHLLSIHLILMLSASVQALAQERTATDTLVHGGIESGFLFAPDFKLTDVDGDFGILTGGYGGWVIDRRFLLGGGIYTLANGSESESMTYGGGVFEYFLNEGALVNVSLRGLVGGGSATLGGRFPGLDLDLGRRPGFGLDVPGFGRNVGGFVDDLRGRFEDRFGDGFSFSRSTSFFVAEPGADVILNISETFRLSFGGGYRFIGGAGRLNDRLDGFTASAALKMSFF